MDGLVLFGGETTEPDERGVWRVTNGTRDQERMLILLLGGSIPQSPALFPRPPEIANGGFGSLQWQDELRPAEGPPPLPKLKHQVEVGESGRVDVSGSPLVASRLWGVTTYQDLLKEVESLHSKLNPQARRGLVALCENRGKLPFGDLHTALGKGMTEDPEATWDYVRRWAKGWAVSRGRELYAVENTAYLRVAGYTRFPEPKPSPQPKTRQAERPRT